MLMATYRGRLAPSPTGYLHLGHARTFWVAWQRARAAHGKLIFRNEDLDYQRCKPEFVKAMYEDLRWLGLDWDEGPDIDDGLADGEVSSGMARSREAGAGSLALIRRANAAASISTHGASCATAA